MKSHMMKPPDDKIQEVMRKHLVHQWAVGASYGSMAFAQVVRDKIDKFEGDDKSALIEDISNFLNTTLKNSPDELIAAYEEISKKAAELQGKEVTR